MSSIDRRSLLQAAVALPLAPAPAKKLTQVVIPLQLRHEFFASGHYANGAGYIYVSGERCSSSMESWNYIRKYKSMLNETSESWKFGYRRWLNGKQFGPIIWGERMGDVITFNMTEVLSQ